MSRMPLRPLKAYKSSATSHFLSWPGRLGDANSQPQRAAEDLLHDLVGPTADRPQPGVAHRAFDLRLGLSAAGLGAITLALNEAPTPWALGSARFLLVIVGGFLLLAGFALVERRIRNPRREWGGLSCSRGIPAKWPYP
jgi:hypothetical protein